MMFTQVLFHFFEHPFFEFLTLSLSPPRGEGIKRGNIATIVRLILQRLILSAGRLGCLVIEFRPRRHSAIRSSKANRPLELWSFQRPMLTQNRANRGTNIPSVKGKSTNTRRLGILVSVSRNVGGLP